MIFSRIPCLLVFAIGVSALPPPDGIAAIVGGHPILLSEVAEASFAVPGAASMPLEARLEAALQALIDDRMLLWRADFDSVRVTEGEVADEVEDRMQQLTEQAGGPEALGRALQERLGLTSLQWRSRLVRQTLDERRKDIVRRQHVDQTPPGREEVLAFHRLYRDSLPTLPDQVRLSQIRIDVKPSSAHVEASRAAIDSLLNRLRRGEVDFAEAARTLSDDPGSAPKGGDIGFFGLGELDPAYERAALGLEVGQIVRSPVRSRFGWHVIRLDARRDRQFRTSHILFLLQPDSQDSARARGVADSIRSLASSGEDFERLARLHSDDASTASFGGRLGWFPEARLPDAMRLLVADLPEGRVSEPLLVPEGWLLLRVDSRRAARELSPEEDWQQLAQFAAQVRQRDQLAGLLARWRNEVVIERRAGPDDLVAHSQAASRSFSSPSSDTP